ncbi:hypothetical protein G8770_09360 [Aestuariicella hydrocarbonica]|uniref:Murein lipoprotein n=1 Tax=Pseudomaricurvus hydrocarbonicus TaxID=1470433 RepID=A0A9E5JZU2_9GAMM|nr:Lpp/OprI family alanine-zipper lipoprotein [Aestuariicella hydrocarbonica]NHO65747.1 hypothetical protein [Aestuariicella hydrocarbonica]
MNTLLKTTVVGVFLAALTGMSGCASTSKAEIDAMKTDIRTAQDTANRAASDAAAARNEAAAAREAAEQARNAAMETNEKLDRMYKKSMYK